MYQVEVSGGIQRSHKRREDPLELLSKNGNSNDDVHFLSLSLSLSLSSTATTPTPPPKTGLQWQQPFLELVLACMNSHHSNHDELLVPLQKQLTTFLTAFEKVFLLININKICNYYLIQEGMPLDEQNKGMLYTALRLRLSLVRRTCTFTLNYRM